MRADGTDVKQLTGHTPQGECYRPSWSPDGRRLCFASRRDGYSSLYLVDRDGGGEQRLTAEPADDDFAAWSPDGVRIVFSRGNQTGADALFILDLASGAIAQLTDHYGLESSPAWSPDGRSIAFRRAFGRPPGIHVIPAEGGEAWFLTPGDEPGWSPSGDRLAFSHAESLWLLALDGTGRPAGEARRVTDGIRHRDGHPSWSPDGRQIAFERQPLADDDSASQIVLMERDGTEVTTLAEGRTPDLSPRPLGA